MPKIATRHVNSPTGRWIEIHVEDDTTVVIDGRAVISYDDPAEALADAAEFLQEALDMFPAATREGRLGQTQDRSKEAGDVVDATAGR